MSGSDPAVYERLLPFQCFGTDWLAARRRAMLCDRMGLGKTPQAIRAADKLHLSRLLIVCPAIARINWLRKIEEWGLWPRSVEILEHVKQRISPHVDVAIINYDLLKHHAKALGELQYDVAIFDEAHYLMSPDALRTQWAYGKDGLLRHADRWWLLTASPIRSHAGQLWTHLRSLFPYEMRQAGLPLEYDKFMRRFCVIKQTPYGEKVIGNKDAGALKAFLEGRMLRRHEHDVLPELPPIRFDNVALPGAADEISLLEAGIGEDIVTMASRMITAGRSPTEVDALIASMVAQQGQWSTFRRLSGLAMVKPTIELMTDKLEGGLDKAIIFAHHREVVENLVGGMAPYNPVFIYGGMTAAAKQRAMDAFNGRPDVRVMVGQITAAGVAIDLVAGADVTFAEMSSVPDDNIQAFKRAHRIGQLRDVRVRFLTLAGTICEQLTRACAAATQRIAELLPLHGAP